MAHRVARGRARGGGLRQRTDWARLVNTDDVNVAVSTKVVLATFLSGQVESTVRRSLVEFHVQSDQAAAQEDQFGAIGIMIASDAAVAAGAASLLGPVTDASDDVWLLWYGFVQRGGSDATPDSPGQVRFVDSRGQRRLQEGQQAVLMVENASAAFVLKISFAASVLFGSGLQRR